MKKSSALRVWVSIFSLLAFSSSLLNAAEEIKIASTGAGLSTLPLEIAARKGFFRDEGFEVLTITMRTNIAVNALLSRSVEYATPSTSTIKAASAGLPVKTIAVLLGRPDYFLTVKRDVKTVRDLKGTRIASGSFGAAADLALRTVAKQDGLDPDRDLIRLQMGGAAARYASLISGSVDATILTLPYNLQAEKAGYKDLLWFGERLELLAIGLGDPRRNDSEKSQASLRRSARGFPRHGLRQRQPRENRPVADKLAQARSRGGGKKLRVRQTKLVRLRRRLRRRRANLDRSIPAGAQI